MKFLKFFIVLILFNQTLFAQKLANNQKNVRAQKVPVSIFEAIDKKIIQLPDSLTKTTTGISNYISSNFKTDKDKIRAIYFWVTSNIQYDTNNKFAINIYESKENKISKALKTRKGICENYVALFNDICSKSGIKNFKIEGYTKQNELTDYIPHVWCAARIDSSWYLFDPTWGAGYIMDGKYYPEINNDFFMASPAVLIKSHIPYDFIWQFLNYPITNQEFYEGRTEENKSKPYFNFIDSIKAYENKDIIDQKISAAYRIEKNGIKNSWISEKLKHVRLEIENERKSNTMKQYNSAVTDYNEGIHIFNEFVNYRNRHFTPLKPDHEIQKMLDTPDNKFKTAKIKLSQIVNPDKNLANEIMQLMRSIENVTSHLLKQQYWLKLYLSKEKAARSLFIMES